MAYDRKKIFEQSKELIVKHKLFFIEDIISFLPITKPTFYDYFKVDSNEFNELKDLLEKNKIEVKSSLRSKWYKSEAPALQLALMKIICTDEERKRLSMTHVDSTTNGKDIQPIGIMSSERIKEISNELEDEV
jgi:hypothetical protein